MNSRDIQVWDNAAFDNHGGISDCSWSHINNNTLSFESDCSKENITPCLIDSSLSPKSKPVKMINNVAKKTGVLEERNLDLEIEQIEKEITRLSTRLESLRLEKAKRNAELMKKKKTKIMEPVKRGVRTSDEQVKNVKTPRRGVSLGPAEIMRGMRRGISLGPAEILKNLGRPEITPVQSSASRRKSCYWKLQDIDELRVTKERGRTMSLSPKSRSKTTAKPQNLNQNQIPNKAATAIGLNRTVKKQDGVLSSIQPKKLFVKDGDKSGPSKKPFKSGRVVPSRYNQFTSGGSSALKELRKRSWPDNEDEVKRSEKKRVSLVSTDTRVKKPWDTLEAVPRIKTNRCVTETPRDSGPAKRVSELVGKKSFFSMDDESVCQALNFEEDQAGKEFLKIRVLRSINESPRDSGAAKRVSQLVGRKPFFAADHDDDMPVFSFEEDDEN